MVANKLRNTHFSLNSLNVNKPVFLVNFLPRGTFSSHPKELIFSNSCLERDRGLHPGSPISYLIGQLDGFWNKGLDQNEETKQVTELRVVCAPHNGLLCPFVSTNLGVIRFVDLALNLCTSKCFLVASIWK